MPKHEKDGTDMKNVKVVFPDKKCVELIENDIPELRPNEALVETIVSQISTGTELTRLEGEVEQGTALSAGIKYPVYPGYSNVGKIIAIGEDVDKSMLGKCVLTAARHEKYAVRPVDQDMVVVPDDVDPEEAVFGSLGCVAMASIRSAEIRPGDTVLVFGAGLVGHLLARLAKIAGALNVFVADVSDYRLSMLPEDKCFHKINTAKEDIVEALGKYGKQELARVVFEATTVPALVEKELACVQRMGRFVLTSSMRSKALIDLEYVSNKGVTIVSGANWTVHTPVAVPRDPWTRSADTRYFMDLLSNKEICLKGTITHRANYKDAVQMYQMLMQDRTQALCVLLNWND